MHGEGGGARVEAVGAQERQAERRERREPGRRREGEAGVGGEVRKEVGNLSIWLSFT